MGDDFSREAVQLQMLEPLFVPSTSFEADGLKVFWVIFYKLGPD
jgi:hypothetical protein